MSLDFYTRCGLKGPTLTLFKIKNGDSIAAYNPYDWYKSPYSIKSRGTFINLSKCIHFRSFEEAGSKSSMMGPNCKYNLGPCFHANNTIQLSA